MQIRHLSWAGVISFLAAGAAVGAAALAAQAPTITSFSPEGVVKGIRQVRASFSEAMVPFGDPGAKREAFEIKCPAKGTARWSDSKNWVYDFDADLPAGVECEFKLKAQIQSVSGQAVEGKTSFKFSTGGPAVMRSSPWNGSRIQEDQYFILSLDSPVDEKSVENGAWFAVDGIGDRIALKIVTGRDREDILNSENPVRRVRVHHNKKGKVGALTDAGNDEKPELVVRAQRPFPAGGKVQLIWGKGIRSASGVATAEDQTLKFEVRPEFRANFTCERENASMGCIPISELRVDFSNIVFEKDLRDARLEGPGGAKWQPYRGPRDNSQQDETATTSSVSFKGPFPPLTSFKVVLPKGLKDDSGRELANAGQFPLEIKTEDYPPLAKFAADFGIIESGPQAALPVTLRKIEPVIKTSIEARVHRVERAQPKDLGAWLVKLGQHGYGDRRANSILEGETAERLALPKPAGGSAFEVIGVPFSKPGFYIVELKSSILGSHLLGADRPMYVSSGALVTNLAVHFKHGRESSVAWVTSLDQGKPVEGAQVEVRDCAGKSFGSARTDRDGIARFAGLPAGETQCEMAGEKYTSYGHGLFVSAAKGDDFSFVHTDWKHGIEPWRFQLGYGSQGEPWLAHTVFDRTLFRAGETVHMKHFIRYHTGQGFAPVPESRRPKYVELRHDGSGQKYELPIAWRKDGTAESTWEIPREGKLGEYSVTLRSKAQAKKIKKGEEQGMEEGEELLGYRYSRSSSGESWHSGEFRVEEYRVPLMEGKIRAPSEKQVAPKSIPLDLSASYLAGGGASGLPIVVRYQVQDSGSANFDEFEGFEFADGFVKEGEEEHSWERDENAEEPRLKSLSSALDKAGTVRVTAEDLKKPEKMSTFSAELEYRDPNGEIQTSSLSFPIYPAERLVGIQADSSSHSGKEGSPAQVGFQVAVADPSGKPVPGAQVAVDFYRRKTYSHRKRLLGGFYAYDNKTMIEKVGPACEAKTDARGIARCDVKAPENGNLILQARTRDQAGRESGANRQVWVYGGNPSWGGQEDSDRIDLIPERKRYEPGETAQFQVKMPFKEATALVTTEREGVIESFVQKLDSREPLIRVPVKGGYAPNVYVSALVVRGRVGEPQPTALVDLGKPAYKLGISEIKVGWQAHELQVKVKPERDTYRVREKARAKIRVKAADGSNLAPGTEAAVAVVDEGLLLLKPNESWKLLESFMNRRAYEVLTSTAQTQVIGKRHFGLKALPQGGDGGKAPTRELFDTLLLWKARVALDSRGEAEIEFPLNDSITSFKIVAVAADSLGKFGTGSAQVRSTQDLMSFASLPPVVREGDQFPAEFTLRNASQAPLELEAELKVTPMLQPAGQALEPRHVTLQSGEATAVAWPLTVPSGLEKLGYVLEVRSGGRVLDSLKASQRILPAVPVRTTQATLEQLDSSGQPLILPVEKPAAALEGKGGLKLTLQPTLLGSLDGVIDYMGTYPYTCLEQRASRAIALRDEALWIKVTADLPAYLDSDGLAKFFPDMTQGSDVLTSYLLAVSEEAGWDIPASVRDRMLAGLKRFVEGKVARWSVLPASDLALRKIEAIEALSRYKAATPDLLASIEIAPNLWPTSTDIQWWNILKRVTGISEQAERLKSVDQILRSRLTFNGSAMGFSSENIDQLWWMMVSTDENANRLILSALSEASWRGDLPRMMRGSLHRQGQGHWLTTPANAWGRLAVEKFAREFEKQAVSGVTTAKLATASAQEADWKAYPKGRTLDFDWPASKSALSVSQKGTGKPWVLLRAEAAIPLTKPEFAGYKVTRSWEPVEQKEKGRWSRGDIVRVHLDLEAQSDMSWVVVNDPVPAGASILGTGLGQDSKLATQGEKQKGWVWPTFQERAFDSLRSYYEWVPKGKWSIEYTIRLNQSGKMNQPPTRVEAMYAPEIYGEAPNASVAIQ